MGIIRTQIVDDIPPADGGRTTRYVVIIPFLVFVTAGYRREKCMCTREYRGHRTRRDTTGESGIQLRVTSTHVPASRRRPIPVPPRAPRTLFQCMDLSWGERREDSAWSIP